MKTKAIASLIVVMMGIVVIVMISGCSQRNEVTPPIKPTLFTKIETNYGSDGLYRVTGNTFNQGTTTARNAYVHITFVDVRGTVLHEQDEQLGDIEPSGEQSFSYNWAGPSGVDVRAQSDSD